MRAFCCAAVIVSLTGSTGCFVFSVVAGNEVTWAYNAPETGAMHAASRKAAMRRETIGGQSKRLIAGMVCRLNFLVGIGQSDRTNTWILQKESYKFNMMQNRIWAELLSSKRRSHDLSE
jgi:hypothetical protein